MEETPGAVQEAQAPGTLLGGAFKDLTKLLGLGLELGKQELKEQWGKAVVLMVALALTVPAIFLAVTLLAFAASHLVAEALSSSVAVGFCIVGLSLGVSAIAAFTFILRRARSLSLVPHETLRTIQAVAATH